VNDKPALFFLRDWSYSDGIHRDELLDILKQGGVELHQRSSDSFLETEDGELVIENPFYDPSLNIAKPPPVPPPPPLPIGTLPSTLIFKKECESFEASKLDSNDSKPQDISVQESAANSIKDRQTLIIRVEYEVRSPNCPAIVFSDSSKTLHIAGLPRPAAANRNEYPIYGKARYWIPCVDRIHEKCSWDLYFSVHEGVNQDGTSAEDEITPIVACSGQLISNRDEFHFHISESMKVGAPLIAIAAGAYHVLSIPLDIPVPEDCAVYPPRALHVYYPTTINGDISHSIHIAAAVLDFYSDMFGMYPFGDFGVHKLVFSANVFGSLTNNGAGVTLLDVDWLCEKNNIDRTFEQRRTLMQAFAYQWFGCWVIPKNWGDYWTILGLSSFMASRFFKLHFGKNEFQYRLKRDVLRLANLDVHMPPLHYLPHHSLDFLCLKSSLVVYALDKKMSKVAASSGLPSCIQKILPSRILSSNGLQRWIRKESSVVGLRTFWNQWVEGVGVPRIEFSYSQNNGRQVIEFDMAQENTSVWGSDVGMRPGLFTGSITVSVYEIDGVLYTHALDVARATQHFEVRFNSRYKYKKMMGKTNENAPKEEEEEEWISAVKDDNGSENHRWIQWVWVDPDVEWPCPVTLKQPDFKWARLINHTPNVLCQFDVVSHLRHYPSVQCAQLLHKIASDIKVFYWIRVDAVTALVSCAIAELDWIGLELLLDMLKHYSVSRSEDPMDVIPKTEKWMNLADYMVYKAVLMTLCSLKSEQGRSPSQVKRLILNLLRFNDSVEHKVNANEHMAFLISCLCQVMLPLPNHNHHHHGHHSSLPGTQQKKTGISGANLENLGCQLPAANGLESGDATPFVPAEHGEDLDMGFGFFSDSEASEAIESEPPDLAREDELPSLGMPSDKKEVELETIQPIGKFQLVFDSTPDVLDESLELLEDIRILELLGGFNVDVTIACLNCLCQWMLAGLIPIRSSFFLKYSDVEYPFKVRKASFQALFLLNSFLVGEVAEYLLYVMVSDISPVIQVYISQCFRNMSILCGAREKGALREKKLHIYEAFKDFSEKILPSLGRVLESSNTSREVQECVMSWIFHVFSPPIVKVKVKWSTVPKVQPITTSTLPSNVSKNWQPPYVGVAPSHRVSVVAPSLLNAGIAVVERLKTHPIALPFCHAVPPTVPGYYQQITDPMDLSCIERKLRNGHYFSLEELFADVQKIFRNCWIFNHEDSDISRNARILKDYFESSVVPNALDLVPPPKPMEMTEEEWKKCRKIARKLREKSSAAPFLKHVTDVPKYYDVILHPIDLGTIRKKIENKEYPTVGSFEADIHLMFHNCFTFNLPGDEVYRAGMDLQSAFCKEWKLEFPVSVRLKSLPISTINRRKSIEPAKETNSSRKSTLAAVEVAKTPNIGENGTESSSVFMMHSNFNQLILQLFVIGPFEDLKTSNRDVASDLRRIHQIFLDHPESFDFRFPVDPLALGIPSYFKIIKNPMDLQTIGNKIPTYTNELSYLDDIRLMLNNAITFNPKEAIVYKSSFKFYEFVKEEWQKAFGVSSLPSLEPHRPDKKARKTSAVPAPEPRALQEVQLAKPSSLDTVDSKHMITPIELREQSPSDDQSELLTPWELERCEAILRRMTLSKFADPFLHPVDPIRDGVPQYREYVQKPMDFSTLQENLLSGHYLTLKAFEQDLLLIFQNCVNFNGKDHIYSKQAGTLRSQFQSEWRKLLNERQKLVLTDLGNERRTTGAQAVGPNLEIEQPLIPPGRFTPPIDLSFDPVKALKVLSRLQNHRSGIPFLYPVDPVALNVPTYFDVIKQPMDFTTVESKIKGEVYRSMSQFSKDVRLIFDNCFKFNRPGDPVFNMGKECLKLYERECARYRFPATSTVAANPNHGVRAHQSSASSSVQGTPLPSRASSPNVDSKEKKRKLDRTAPVVDQSKPTSEPKKIKFTIKM
jgi:hypothetical protein